MMLALPICCYANRVFSSRRIGKATFRDVAVRFVAADTHPDHDTAATFRREHQAAFAAAFASVLEMARELRGQPEADIAAPMARAEAADEARAERLPKEVARREALKAKRDAARTCLEARERAAGEQAAYEKKLAGHRARNGQSRGPKLPDDTPDPDKQSNLTNPDSNLMRTSNRHEYRQACNARAVVDADDSQLVMAGVVSQNASDAPGFEATIAAPCDQVGRPTTVLGDAGFANGEAIKIIEARKIEVLAVVSRPNNPRTCDFRPLKPDARPPPEPEAGWRKRMRETRRTEAARERHKRRKCTVEPVFGIIRNVLGFNRFHLGGIENVKAEGLLVALADNCKRLCNLNAAKAAAA